MQLTTYFYFLLGGTLMENCIFCRIASGEIPSQTVYEDDYFRAILDLSPASKGHTLILPKKHFKDVTELDETYAAKILPLAAKIGQAMKTKLGCAGFNIVQNNGEAAGQTVMHYHMHIIPRYADGPQMVIWEPKESNPDEQAQIASLLSEALK